MDFNPWPSQGNVLSVVIVTDAQNRVKTKNSTSRRPFMSDDLQKATTQGKIKIFEEKVGVLMQMGGEKQPLL